MRRTGILTVFVLRTILGQPEVGVLIALGVGGAAHVPDGGIAAHVALGKHVVGLQTDRQEAPALHAAPTVAAGPLVRRDERGQHRAAGVDGSAAPVALSLVVVIVDLEDRFRAPFAALLPKVGVVGVQRVVAAGDELLHEAERTGIAGSVVLVHHQLGIKHVGKSLAHAACLTGLPAQGQHARGDDVLQLRSKAVVDLVGRELRSRVGVGQVLKIEGHVAVEMPQNAVVIDAQQACLHLNAAAGRLRSAVPRGILDGVVAALDAAVEVAPERSQRVVAVAFEVEQLVPVLVVGGTAAAYPEVVAQNLGVDGQVVVSLIVPVGPVQGCIGGGQRLVEACVGRIVFLKRLARRVLHIEEVIAASRKGCGHAAAHHGADGVCLYICGNHNF